MTYNQMRNITRKHGTGAYLTVLDKASLYTDANKQVRGVLGVDEKRTVLACSWYIRVT